MKKVPGYSLLLIGLIGFGALLMYRKLAIPMKELLLVLSMFITLAGAYVVARFRLQQLTSAASDSARLTAIETLKRQGEKVRVTLDNAEVKTRSYHEQVINEGLPSRMELLDAIYDDNRNYKTTEVQQTYIVFYKSYNGRAYRFVSGATRQSADAVKLYLHKAKGVDLYIDPLNPEQYYFDLTFF